jgi:hypothetical protein
VARDLAWSAVLAAKADTGFRSLKTADGAPRLALKNGAWPPPQFVSREVAA